MMPPIPLRITPAPPPGRTSGVAPLRGKTTEDAAPLGVGFADLLQQFVTPEPTPFPTSASRMVPSPPALLPAPQLQPSPPPTTTEKKAPTLPHGLPRASQGSPAQEATATPQQEPTSTQADPPRRAPGPKRKVEDLPSHPGLVESQVPLLTHAVPSGVIIQKAVSTMLTVEPIQRGQPGAAAALTDVLHTGPMRPVEDALVPHTPKPVGSSADAPRPDHPMDRAATPPAPSAPGAPEVASTAAPKAESVAHSLPPAEAAALGNTHLASVKLTAADAADVTVHLRLSGGNVTLHVSGMAAQAVAAYAPGWNQALSAQGMALRDVRARAAEDSPDRSGRNNPGTPARTLMGVQRTSRSRKHA
jgi:hypothetical protein